uniref:KIB1-4 beta-propeller domain-containing protein n=1 Tax=Oryza punctata TaxID=4537 RepID=A0A0E0L3Y1_ORYPU
MDATWCNLTTDILRLIHKRLPCLVDRRNMARVCHSWRAAVKGEQHPLPWILGGCRRHDFGTYSGGWLFLAFGNTPDHGLLSLRSKNCFRLPENVCVDLNPEFQRDMIINHSNSSNFQVDRRGNLDLAPMEIRRFQLDGRDYDGRTVARYLVESRENLLMVDVGVQGVRDGGASGWDSHQQRRYAWNELESLGGRILFVARGCSRSYDAGDYQGLGFSAGVYFLDDGRIYNEFTMFLDDDTARSYPCRESGKWLPAPGGGGGGQLLAGASPVELLTAGLASPLRSLLVLV